MKVEWCHLVSANLSLLRETLVAKGSCCCCVEMHEICKFNPFPGPPLINWLVVLVGPQLPSGVCDISKSGLDMEVMGKGAAKHSCLPNVWKWWDEKSLLEGGGGKEGGMFGAGLLYVAYGNDAYGFGSLLFLALVLVLPGLLREWGLYNGVLIASLPPFLPWCWAVWWPPSLSVNDLTEYSELPCV